MENFSLKNTKFVFYLINDDLLLFSYLQVLSPEKWPIDEQAIDDIIISQSDSSQDQNSTMDNDRLGYMVDESQSHNPGQIHTHNPGQTPRHNPGHSPRQTPTYHPEQYIASGKYLLVN